jgi:hypothetical protein
MRYGRRTREYDRAFDKYYHLGEAGYAFGGRVAHNRSGLNYDEDRVDGAGLVDGIHTDPRECSHLAAGGVCRHQPSFRWPPGEDFADRPGHARNF